MLRLPETKFSLTGKRKYIFFCNIIECFYYDSQAENKLQSNLDYLDSDYPDYSIIRTFFSGPNFSVNTN